MHTSSRPGFRSILAAVTVLVAGAGLVFSAQRPAVREPIWDGLGGSTANSRYFTGTQITRENVRDLTVRWNYPFGETAFAPIVAHGVIYGRGRGGALIALDARTGQEIWIREGMTGMTTRGMNYWESPDGSDRRLIFAVADYLQELDARTGLPIKTFGTNGGVDLREGLGRDPATIGRIQSGTPGEIFENLILLGSATGEGYLSPPGDLRAYDVVSGRLVWQFHTVPHPGEFGFETWPPLAYKYAGGTNTWGELSVDTARGIAYFPTGSPTFDYYGGDRIGANLFSTSLVALDARTGRRLWHFQAVHHDLWDFDNNAAPQLTTIQRNGRSIDVVAMAGKTGFLYVFDRVTGDPVWPIEERPVPRSRMTGEESWPTQPFVVGLPPFARQSALSTDDINPYGNVTPAARQTLIDRLAKANNAGLFTPIDLNDTVHIPGANGGALFGTTSSDPSGNVYVITQDNPGVLRLYEPAPPGARGGRGAGALVVPGQAVYTRECASCHGPERAGTGDGPSLLDLAQRVDAAAISTAVASGTGRMPAMPHITPADIDLVATFLLTPAGGGRAGGPGRGGNAPSTYPPGPVVGRGPVVVREGGRGGGRGELPYPDGAPAYTRYTHNGEYGNISALMKPPYTTIVKYDLNAGVLKWRIPFGDDPVLAALGITGTGVTQMRNAVVLTSTGLLFGPARDGRIYAWATDTGAELWRTTVGGNMVGQPTLFTLDGRDYLLMAAGPAPVATGRTGLPAPVVPTGPTGYIAYALPR